MKVLKCGSASCIAPPENTITTHSADAGNGTSIGIGIAKCVDPNCASALTNGTVQDPPCGSGPSDRL